MSFLQLLDAIRTVTKANIVAADLNELAPTLDTTGVSTATACKVLRETLIALDKGWPGFQVETVTVCRVRAAGPGSAFLNSL